MTNNRHLENKGILALVTVLGMAPPLSTDMYMPSLPVMAGYFNTSTLLINLTLIVFFLFMALGTLFFGPVSDRLGRKKPLILALSLYFAGSMLCSASFNVYMLIGARSLQAFGAGGMVSLSIAIIKDCFKGKTRDTALATVQSMSVIAPIASPVIGALIIRFSTWRMVFIILAIIAALLLIAVIFFEESIHEDERHNGTIKESLKNMTVISRNINFMPFLLSVSIFSAPFMAYLAVASYTYQDYFGLSATQFSMFFAINAGFSILGPIIYVFISGRAKKKNIMNILLLSSMLFSILLFLLGQKGPVVFLCCFIPYGVTTSLMRPYSTSILLDQFKGNTGSASSLLNFTNTLLGSIGMLMGSMPWHSYVHGLALVIALFTLISTAIWIYILKSSRISMSGIHRPENGL